MTTGTTTKKGAGNRRSAEQWRTLIQDCERSGQSRKAFCARRGVAMSTFDWWRRKLAEEFNAGDRGAGVATKAVPVFIELAKSPDQPAATNLPWDVELDLGAGMVLRLRRATC